MCVFFTDRQLLPHVSPCSTARSTAWVECHVSHILAKSCVNTKSTCRFHTHTHTHARTHALLTSYFCNNFGWSPTLYIVFISHYHTTENSPKIKWYPNKPYMSSNSSWSYVNSSTWLHFPKRYIIHGLAKPNGYFNLNRSTSSDLTNEQSTMLLSKFHPWAVSIV